MTQALRVVAILVSILQVLPTLLAQTEPSIPPGSKVYIHPMNGFETYLRAGLTKKKVPLSVVADRDKADFEITGTVEIEKEEGTKGWKKVAEIGLTGGHQGSYYNLAASLSVNRIDSGDVVFAYSVAKSSYKAQQSAAEAFAKHLKKSIRAK